MKRITLYVVFAWVIAVSVSVKSIMTTQDNGSSLIGTTRETVSRLFADFKKKHLLHVQAATLVVHNRLALEQMVQS